MELQFVDVGPPSTDNCPVAWMPKWRFPEWMTAWPFTRLETSTRTTQDTPTTVARTKPIGNARFVTLGTPTTATTNRQIPAAALTLLLRYGARRTWPGPMAQQGPEGSRGRQGGR